MVQILPLRMTEPQFTSESSAWIASRMSLSSIFDLPLFSSIASIVSAMMPETLATWPIVSVPSVARTLVRSWIDVIDCGCHMRCTHADHAHENDRACNDAEVCACVCHSGLSASLSPCIDHDSLRSQLCDCLECLVGCSDGLRVHLECALCADHLDELARGIDIRCLVPAADD